MPGTIQQMSSSLQTKDFAYHLPPENIAHRPMTPRDHSKLLRVNRATQSLSDFHFYDLPDLLDDSYVLVRNNTKVIPARLYGQKTTGGKVELLLTKKITHSPTTETWECMTKPGLQPGQKVGFSNSNLTATCTQETGYTRSIQFNMAGHELLSEFLTIGATPLPPYIDSSQQPEESQLRQEYQTLYAQHQGSAAAPTAGLHFTPEIDKALLAKGIEILEVTLHVGLGTFLRVKTDNIADHHMHTEDFVMPEHTATALKKAKQSGKKIISVGTTTTRVLESCYDAEAESFRTGAGSTDIFMYPPYKFNVIDGLITNFHESESTLLMLVNSLVSAPNTKHTFTTMEQSVIGKAYAHAIENKYRLLSFGDAMLII